MPVARLTSGRKWKAELLPGKGLIGSGLGKFTLFLYL